MQGSHTITSLLLRIQDAALLMDTLTLVIAGLVAVGLGLFLWLGGTRYSSMVLGLCGGALGALVGVLVARRFGFHTALAVVIGAAVVALAAVLLQRVVIVMLAAVIFTVLSGASYLSYHYHSQDWQNKLDHLQAIAQQGDNAESASDAGLNTAAWAYVQQLRQARLAGDTSGTSGVGDGASQGGTTSSGGVGSATVSDGGVGGRAWSVLRSVVAELRYALSENRGMVFLWAVLGGVIGLVLAYLLAQVMMALCCSLVGAAATVSGVLALLLAKGTPVISRLVDRPKVMPTILVAMVLFGWLVQLLLARSGRKHSRQENDDEKE